MNQQSYEVKCPNCDNLIPLDVANFCGACGQNVSHLKVNHFNSQAYNFHNQQQQFYNQQQHFNQLPPTSSKGALYTFSVIIKSLTIFTSILVLIAIIVFVFVKSNYDGILDSKLDGGIHESLFYNYFMSDYNTSVQAETYFSPGGISDLEYAKLDIGMSYALASFIIGGDGDLVNTGENLQNKFYYTYRWFSEIDEDLVFYITFVEDEISEIMLDHTL